MGRYRENTTLFTKLAYSLGRTPRPAATPPSESLGSPAPQASFSTSFHISCLARILRFHPILAVFKLSDELILYIFSHIDISPDLRHPAISRHIWFRILCSMGIYDHHLQRQCETSRRLFRKKQGRRSTAEIRHGTSCGGASGC